jgi:CheY-like chemotaxis protein
VTVPASSAVGGPHALVVDGDADNRALYRDALTLAGWRVTEASDGREALVQALLVKPWVIITELRLPLIDGISLCEILRRDHVTQAVPIVVVTGESRATELARAEHAGASAFLIKPCTPDVLLAETHRLVQGIKTAAAPAAALPTSGTRRTALVKAHHRHATTTPDVPAIDLSCPICNQALKYQETFIGGVSSRQSERWDYYVCLKCGPFQYRQRTRRLRQMS